MKKKAIFLGFLMVVFLFVAGCGGDEDDCNCNYTDISNVSRLTLDSQLNSVRKLTFKYTSQSDGWIVLLSGDTVRGYHIRDGRIVLKHDYLESKADSYGFFITNTILLIATYSQVDKLLKLYRFDLLDGNLSEIIVSDFVPVSGEIKDISLWMSDDDIFLAYISNDSVVSLISRIDGEWSNLSITADQYGGSGFLWGNVDLTARNGIVYISFYDAGKGKPYLVEVVGEGRLDYLTIVDNDIGFGSVQDLLIGADNVPELFFSSEIGGIFYSRLVTDTGEIVDVLGNYEYIGRLKAIEINGSPYVFYYSGENNYLGAIVWNNTYGKWKRYVIAARGMPGYFFDLDFQGNIVGVVYWNAMDGGLYFKEIPLTVFE